MPLDGGEREPTATLRTTGDGSGGGGPPASAAAARAAAAAAAAVAAAAEDARSPRQFIGFDGDGGCYELAESAAAESCRCRRSRRRKGVCGPETGRTEARAFVAAAFASASRSDASSAAAAAAATAAAASASASKSSASPPPPPGRAARP